MSASTQGQNEKIVDIKCDSCCSSYDRDQNVPRILPLCNHALCHKCITEIISSSGIFACPFCSKQDTFGCKEADEFPLNTVILNVMYAPQKKRKLNDGTGKPSLFMPIIKKEEDEEQHIKVEKYLPESNNADFSFQTQVGKEQSEPKVLQQFMKSKMSRLNDEQNSYATSNNSSRSLMRSAGSKYIFRSNSQTQQKLNEKRKSSQNIEQYQCQSNSKPLSEDSNSKSMQRSLINTGQNSRNFSQANCIQSSKSAIQKPSSQYGQTLSMIKLNKMSNDTMLNKGFTIKLENKDNIHNDLASQNSQGFHTAELNDKQSLYQKSLQQNSLYGKVKQEAGVTNKPKFSISAQQLQAQLIPFINKNTFNDFLFNSSTENSRDYNFAKPEPIQKCKVHNEDYTYFCESHNKGFCFQCCNEHTFCGNIFLIDIIKSSRQTQINQVIKDETTAVDYLFNLLTHYQDIEKEIYRHETSQVAFIEKTFSELISSLLKKKENMIKDLSTSTKSLQEGITVRQGCIRESIETCQHINQQSKRLNQRINPLSAINDILNFNRSPENSNNGTAITSTEDFTRLIEQQQNNLIESLSQFQEEYSSIKKNQVSVAPTQQPTPINSQSTIQSTNDCGITLQVKKDHSIPLLADLLTFIDNQINDQYESKDIYLKRLPIFNISPDKLIKQNFTSTTLIKSY